MAKKKILVIDDQPEILDILSEIIEILGHEVHAITTGNDLEKIFDVHDIDIVISDYQMPDMTGYDIAKIIKDKYPKVKVYIVSGYHSVLSDEKMVKYGVCGLLDKPFKMDELKEILKD
ncbi:MAG: response regulator [Candidatus Delongbacteria bacterium]|jgi:two-component system cell cycle sensor histidine kinase/response regulator CckA|nr:response regulator [Candidatus Delongbacteria bacterium]